jgi:hypothetical protein
MSEHTPRDQLIEEFVDQLNKLVDAARDDHQEHQETALIALGQQYAALLDFLTETQVREFIDQRDQPPQPRLH